MTSVKHRFAMLAILLATAGLVSAAEPTAGSPNAAQKTAEADIWAFEHAYWAANRDADHAKIIGAWHDEFLGWPEGEPKPIGKEAGVEFVRKNYAKPAPYSFKIEPMGIRIRGDLAVNHYLVHLTWEDGSGKKRSMRITHTLLRDGGRWKMLGGMSASP